MMKKSQMHIEIESLIGMLGKINWSQLNKNETTW